MREFLLRPLTAKVSDIRDQTFVALNVTDSRQDALNVFRKYDRAALPVVDSNGVLVGIVTSDDMLDVAEEEATEDIQKLGGMEARDEPYTTIPLVARFFTMRASGIVVYGSSSASIPPSFWMSSVASSSATSSMSSLVTIPTSTLLESTTGKAARSYLRKAFSASSCESFTLRATNVRSRMSLTFVLKGLSRNSRIRKSSISLPRSSTT